MSMPEMVTEDPPGVRGAIKFALDAHLGQVDKQGMPYFFHLLRVMLACYGDSDTMQVAVLHDVLEDTDTSVDCLLAQGFSAHVVEAVSVLTRDREAETYAEYIDRVRPNSLAARVKIADLNDNLSRVDGLPVLEALRLGSRYRRALKILSGP